VNRRILALIVFLLIAFGLAYLLDYLVLIPILKSSTIQRPSAWSTGLWFLVFGIIRMYTPFLGVIVALFILGYRLKRGLIGYGLRGGRAEYILVGMAIPYAIYLVSLAYGLLLGYQIVNPAAMISKIQNIELGEMDPNMMIVLMLLSAVFNGSTINALAALGEEMGWRGFLLGELGEKLGMYFSAIIIGVIWGLWHAPLILVGYNYPHHPDLIGLSMFTLICIVWSIILSQLRVLGRSVIPSSIMHGNINAVAGMILLSFKGDEIYTSPVGLLGLVASATIALLIALYMRGKNYRVEFYEKGEEVFDNVEY